MLRRPESAGGANFWFVARKEGGLRGSYREHFCDVVSRVISIARLARQRPVSLSIYDP
jgi:hypothetical protein